MKILFIATLFNFSALQGQSKTFPVISTELFSDSERHWYGIHDDSNIINPLSDQKKYSETEITKIADNILLFQKTNGGWPKNYDMKAILTQEQTNIVRKAKAQAHTTFDNSTTFTHVEYLAKVYSITHFEKYKKACLSGLEFILAAQYPNGGWPQYFPLEDNYSRRITFNDGVFIGIMKLLKKVIENDTSFTFVNAETKKHIKAAYEKGLECILNLQIKDNNQLTAWCQQHNETDLQPSWARAFEPPSICNGESAGVVLFLMSIENPSPRIIQSVKCAVAWFNQSKIYITRIQTIQAEPLKSEWKTSTTDRIVVTDSTAPPIWTRYYELKTHRPLFSDRTRELLYSLAEVGRERRSGYGWYTYAPQEVLDIYPKWLKKNNIDNNN